METIEPSEATNESLRNVSNRPVLTIEPKPGWDLENLRELWAYRELFLLLVWRDLKGRYAQTSLGFGWAIIQPFMYMVVFTIIFGNLVGVDSDGVPYPVFSFAGLLAWTYFASSVQDGTGSLISSSQMLTKVYFPKLIIPLAPVLGKLVDLGVGMLLLAGIMAWYGVAPSVTVLALPLFIALAAAASAAVSLWLSALAVQYRDVRYAAGFAIQLLIYASPVVYPVSVVPEKYRVLLALNPMTGIIEAFRAVLLGTGAIPWDLLGIGSLITGFLLITGALYFRRGARFFADIA